MPKPSLALARLPQTTVAALQGLGADLAVARIRRKESLENWAQRMGITVPTLLKLESGDPGVAIGLYATALWLMGRDGALAAHRTAADARGRRDGGRGGRRAGLDRRGRHRAARPAPGSGTRVAAARARAGGAALRRARGGRRRVALVPAVLGATARHEARLAAGRGGGAPLHEAAAAPVHQCRIDLLRGAAHVGSVARGARAVTVGGDGGSRVGDVGQVGVDGGVAPGGDGRGGSAEERERDQR